MRTFGKGRLLRSTVLAGFAASALGGAAFGQEGDVEETDDDEEAEEEGERIVVTGSRIARSEFSSPSPIQILTGEVSRDLGLVDADEVLNQLTVVQGGQTTLGVSTVIQPTQAFTTFGSVTPSLRGLASSITGRSRNLVLINGRRYGPVGVGGAPANPDVSLIPGSMIQRVETLLDGASSVYGSDAIAGVVNYILRSDFEGMEVNAFHEVPRIGDGRQTVMSVLMGSSNDRGNITAAFEYNATDDITRLDRAKITGTGPNGRFCDPEMEINTNTGEIFRSCASFLAGFGVFGPYGTVFPTPGSTNIGVPGWSGLAQPPYNDPSTFGTVFQNETRSHPLDQLATVIPDTERYTFFAQGYQALDLYTAPEVYFEFQYSERNLQSRFFNQGVFEVSDNTPFNPFVDPNNPGQGEQLLVTLFDIETKQNINVVRGLFGVRGELPFLNDAFGSNWNYDLSGLWHRSRGTQQFYGAPRTDNVARILNGSYDANGQFVCALDETIDFPTRPGGSFIDPPTICPEVNFFDPKFVLGGRFENDAYNDFIFAESIQTTQVDQLTFQGFLTGDIYEIPTGGPVSVAGGFEYREDFIRTVNDPLTAVPNSFIGQNTDLGSNGERELWEGFAEVAIPLIQGRRFFENLQLDAATRYIEEEFFGASWTYQIKGEWAPNTWSSLSAGFGTSFRAPDTGEQFGTGTAFAINSRADPCLPSTNTLATDPNTGLIFYDATQDSRPQVTIDLCNALGIQLPSGPNDAAAAAALGLFGIGTPSGSFQNFNVLLRNGGSTSVGPETSEALFVKFTFQQPWIEVFDFNASVNYFEYEVEDSIGQLTTGLILSSCFTDPNATVVNGQVQGNLCNFQQRDPVSKLLNEVNEASFNLGAITSRGLDFNATFDMDLTDLPAIGHVFAPMGDPINMNIVYRATQSLENQEDVQGNGVFTDNLGRYGFPEFQQNVTARFNWNDVSLLWRYRMSDATSNNIAPFGGTTVCIPTLLSRDPNADTSGCTEYIELPDLELHDFSATYTHDTWLLRAGVRNVFDEVVVRDNSIPNDGATGTPFGLGYSLTGRSFFVNVTKSF